MSCNTPLKIKQGKNYITVPCRKCMGCRIQKRNYYSMLARFESFSYYQKNLDSSFVTLTYDDEHLPSNGSLSIEESKKFVKRLREHLSRTDFPNKEVISFGRKVRVPDFKFYIAGEYGSDKKTFRPHYHIILFGVNTFIASDFTRRAWKKGNINVSSLNGARIRYCMKYIDKQYDSDIVPDDSFQVPFSTWSKGLGQDFIMNNFRFVIENNGINNGGRIVPLNQYYRRLYGLDSNVDIMDLKKNEIECALKHNMSLKQYDEWIKFNNELRYVKEARLKGAVSDKYLKIAHDTYIGNSTDVKSDMNINNLALNALEV